MVNLNIYPGVVKLGKFSPGLWFAYSKDANLILGIAVSWSPIGLAYSSH
jgi:hypothetical protein